MLRSAVSAVRSRSFAQNALRRQQWSRHFAAASSSSTPTAPAGGGDAGDAPAADNPALDVTSDPESRSKSTLLHGLAETADEEVVEAVRSGKISQYRLESALKQSLVHGGDPDCGRAVRIRRAW